MLDNYPDILTIDDVRAILRVGKGAAYDAIKSGLVPSFRVGRQIRVYRDALKEAINGGINTTANSR